jgi:hypothetical protein
MVSKNLSRLFIVPKVFVTLKSDQIVVWSDLLDTSFLETALLFLIVLARTFSSRSGSFLKRDRHAPL